MREILRRNLGYKIISLVLAIIAWLVVTNQGGTQTFNGDQTFTIPLVARNQPANIIIMSKLQPVRVHLSGSNPSFNINDIYAYVDLSNGTTGEHNYTVKIDPLPGIKVLDLQPQQVAIRLDTVQEKILPVQVIVSGNPANGYVAGTPIVRPSAVNVRGPSSVLGTLNKVVVEVSLNGANQNMEVYRPVLFRDKEGKPILGPDPTVDIFNTSPSNVDVIVPIQPKGLASKMIPIRVNSTGTVAKGMVLQSLTPTPDSVQVLGPSSTLKGFDSLTLGPVDLTGLAANKVFQIPPDKVSLPSGVSFAAGTALNIVAQVSSGPIQKVIEGVPVEVKNIPDGLALDQAPGAINVTVQGLPDVLNSLTAGQIQLWIDATGLDAGSYTDSKVFWQLPPGVTMVSTPQATFSLKAH